MNDHAGESFDEKDAERHQPDARDHAFAEWLAAPLRTPERLDVTWDERVMSAVLAEARAGNSPHRSSTVGRAGWWTRPRTLAFSPLGGLAVAAVFAALVLAGEWCARWLTQAGETMSSAVAAVRPAPDTVHMVRFVFVDPTAEGVYLVGDFNGWSKEATRLDSTGEGGAWSVSVALESGRHEYAFVVHGPSGERWVADPYAPTVRDEFDTESSVVVLGGPASARGAT